jgi:hypothetical protein
MCGCTSNRLRTGLTPRGGGREITPAALRGVVNDAITAYFREAARCRILPRAAAADGVLRIRDDERAQRVPARPHKTPLAARSLRLPPRYHANQRDGGRCYANRRRIALENCP